MPPTARSYCPKAPGCSDISARLMPTNFPPGNPLSGPVAVTRVPKPWGYEIIWPRTDVYAGKILHVNAGEPLSIQYHNVKDETVHLLAGEMNYFVKLPDQPAL